MWHQFISKLSAVISRHRWNIQNATLRQIWIFIEQRKLSSVISMNFQKVFICKLIILFIRKKAINSFKPWNFPQISFTRTSRTFSEPNLRSSFPLNFSTKFLDLIFGENLFVRLSFWAGHLQQLFHPLKEVRLYDFHGCTVRLFWGENLKAVASWDSTAAFIIAVMDIGGKDWRMFSGNGGGGVWREEIDCRVRWWVESSNSWFIWHLRAIRCSLLLEGDDGSLGLLLPEIVFGGRCLTGDEVAGGLDGGGGGGGNCGGEVGFWGESWCWWRGRGWFWWWWRSWASCRGDHHSTPSQILSLKLKFNECSWIFVITGQIIIIMMLTLLCTVGGNSGQTMRPATVKVFPSHLHHCTSRLYYTALHLHCTAPAGCTALYKDGLHYTAPYRTFSWLHCTALYYSSAMHCTSHLHQLAALH